MTMQRTVGTHWVFRLIPPRPTCDQDVTDAESEIMQAHAEYWRGSPRPAGSLPTPRSVTPPARGGWGVIQGSDEEEVRALVHSDPAVTSGTARMEFGPMLASIIRTAQ